mmetsp:Transcript_19929/g.23079  ORF Transcript_19929/g.23079 Transcript_19929/m.23079 type:complete len:219 (+) Transcript_19929:603-1259(+)
MVLTHGIIIIILSHNNILNVNISSMVSTIFQTNHNNSNSSSIETQVETRVYIHVQNDDIPTMATTPIIPLGPTSKIETMKTLTTSTADLLTNPKILTIIVVTIKITVVPTMLITMPTSMEMEMEMSISDTRMYNNSKNKYKTNHDDPITTAMSDATPTKKHPSPKKCSNFIVYRMVNSPPWTKWPHPHPCPYPPNLIFPPMLKIMSTMSSDNDRTVTK